jgi:ActR/RegA family two-component response regulator
MASKTHKPPRSRARKRPAKPKIRKILLVDDDEVFLRACVRNVGRDRIMFTATNSASAQLIARDELPDLAIVDLFLGTESGIDLLEELKKRDPTLVVVLISGYLSVNSTVLAMKAGATFVSPKPITIREVLHRVETGSTRPRWVGARSGCPCGLQRQRDVRGAAVGPSSERFATQAAETRTETVTT